MALCGRWGVAPNGLSSPNGFWLPNGFMPKGMRIRVAFSCMELTICTTEGSACLAIAEKEFESCTGLGIDSAAGVGDAARAIIPGRFSRLAVNRPAQNSRSARVTLVLFNFMVP